MMRMYAEAIKTSESFVVPEAGHSAHWEQPEIFNRVVLQFIGKH
jgi:pimeloyl-ACP methyl ester carboxylesterase